VAHVGALTLFPIKSLDGVAVDAATIAKHGGFAGDREYAIFDEAGTLVNGKRTSAVHTIRAAFDLPARTVIFSGRDTFALGDPRIDDWLSEHFGFRVVVRAGAFPDHTRTPGPSLISTGTLAAMADAFGLTLAEARLRFRANIEIAGTEAFEEDRYVTAWNVGVVRCGEVRLHAVEHCSRCVVPSRDPRTGVPIPAFSKRISEWRRATLPEWSDLGTLPHFYHLAVLTRVPATEIGKVIRVGDAAGQRRPIGS
jgi:uncharacterized protein YcbX